MKPTSNAQVHAWSTAVRVMVSRKRSSAALGTSIVTSATLAGATSIMKVLQCFYVGGHEHELPNCKHVTSSSKPRMQRLSHIALIEWLWSNKCISLTLHVPHVAAAGCGAWLLLRGMRYNRQTLEHLHGMRVKSHQPVRNHT